MVRRVLVLLLGAGVLAVTGIAELSLCCSLEELSRPANSEIRDCCGNPDCCRSERRGHAQATLSVKAPRGDAAEKAPEMGATHWLAMDPVAAAPRMVAHLSTSRHHPPPLDGRGTHLRISLFRI